MLAYKYIHRNLIEARRTDTDELIFYLVKNQNSATWFELNPYNVW